MLKQYLRDNAGALAAVTGAALCYGSTPVFLRYFAGHLDPWTVNGLRYTTGALFWLPFVVLLLRRPAPAGAPPRISVWKAALLPAAVNIAAQITWGLSPYYVEATVIGFVYKLHFLVTILLGFLVIPAERPLARRPSFHVGAAVCVGGTALMFLPGLRGAGEQSLLGMTLLLTTATLFGSYSVVVRRCMAGYPAVLSFGVVSLYTAGPLLALLFILGDYGQLAAVSPWLAAGVMLSAISGIAFAHVLYYHAIHGLGAIVSTGLLMATPFVTQLGAMLLLGEQLAPVQLAGGLALVAGSVLLLWAQSHAAAPPPRQPEGETP